MRKRIVGNKNRVALREVEEIISVCLDTLYRKDELLFLINNGRGISERGLVFRFAYYLQQEIDKNFPGYFVDCDFNSSAFTIKGGKPVRKSGKLIPDPEKSNKKRKRFIDIIVHKRNYNNNDNLFCFEIKKWNSYNKKAKDKDINNLKYLTSSPKYGYIYGFHLILGKHRQDSRCTIFANGTRKSKGAILCTIFQKGGGK